MRVAVVDRSLCKPDKCQLECIKVCPINRAGDKCIWLGEYPNIGQKAQISEELCIDCALCIKACPFDAIDIVKTPEQLKETPIYRFGVNEFVLFRLPFPAKGEVVGLLGPNGVGKSTALKILSGEIKPNLGTGKEAGGDELKKLFRGSELQNYLSELYKKKLNCVVKPQQVDILTLVKGTVSEVLKVQDERGKLDEIVGRLGMDRFLDRTLSQLSGGELQRVAIAVAMLRKADVYYFDEPSSYLDVYQRLEVAKLIRELSKEASVVVVEHDLATLDFLADKIHVFYGVPGAYGIVSKPNSTRVGINAFLDGFLKEDNMRLRKEPIDFNIPKLQSSAKQEVLVEWDGVSAKLGDFSLEVGKGSIKRGEIIGIFGENALGKTTFAKILAGELDPDAGAVSKRVKISYKPQYIEPPKGTVAEILSKTKSNIYSEDYKSEILRPLEVERLLERRVSSLSGGELQRVFISLCLSREADVYLLDEPSAFLDSEQRLLAAKTIRRFCERKDCSAIIIDHDLFFLSYISDRAIVFSGESSVSGAAREMSLADGFNSFLKSVGITFRKDPQTARPRANKTDSQKDQEQKRLGKYFYV